MLGKDLKILRLENGWSYRKAGKAAGIPFSYISEFEKGIRNPNLDQLLKLLKAYDATRGTL